MDSQQRENGPPAPDSQGDATASTPRNRRRVRLPVILFLLTCVSTFVAGSGAWAPLQQFLSGAIVNDLGTSAGGLMGVRQAVWANWQSGLVYSGALLSILLAHEMGHFVTTVIYRVPASLPFFLPLPIAPIGTLGAVIGMDGRLANRRQIFDIGLAGPLAGLVVAVPVMWLGTQQLDVSGMAFGGIKLDMPLLVRWMMWSSPQGLESGTEVWLGHLRGNPLFMAGWVGFLITGLNMLPVSQLDGGHVLYSVFGPRSRVFARLFLAASLLFAILAAPIWLLMVVLVLLMGPDHPPTSDDTVDIGWFRRVLGVVSLGIPVLCFPPKGFTILQ